MQQSVLSRIKPGCDLLEIQPEINQFGCAAFEICQWENI